MSFLSPELVRPKEVAWDEWLYDYSTIVKHNYKKRRKSNFDERNLRRLQLGIKRRKFKRDLNKEI